MSVGDVGEIPENVGEMSGKSEKYRKNVGDVGKIKPTVGEISKYVGDISA